MLKSYIIIFLLFFSGFLLSQTKNDTISFKSNLKEVVISSTKTSKKLIELPLPATVIGSKEINQFGSVSLKEALVNKTGITTVATRTGTEGIQMQGLDAAYTVILIDGMPVIGRSFGTLDLNRISLSNIERIEIIKGASSSLYGSHALGGVINLITEQNVNSGHQLKTNLNYGSNNTFNSNLIHNYKLNMFNASSTLDYFTTDGYDLIRDDLLKTVNPYFNLTYRTRNSYQINNKNIVSFRGHYFIKVKIILLTTNYHY